MSWNLLPYAGIGSNYELDPVPNDHKSYLSGLVKRLTNRIEKYRENGLISSQNPNTMKKLILSSILLIVFISTAYPQTADSGTVSRKDYVFFQIRLKGGMGQTFTALPMHFGTVTVQNPLRQESYTKTDLVNDFLKTKWGPYGGLNLDIYFHPNIGFGLDGDFFFNKLEFITPDRLTDFMDENSIAGLIESNRKNQFLIYTGLGPSFKLFTNENLDIDLNIRGGLSLLQMGSLDVAFPDFGGSATSAGARFREEILHYDYTKLKPAFGAKAGLYLNYWFAPWIGLTLGADFIHSFVSTKHSLTNPAYVLQYKDPNFFDKPAAGGFDSYAYLYSGNPLDDYTPDRMNVNHFAASVGLVFRIGVGGAGPGVKKQAKEPPVITPAMPEKNLEAGKTYILRNIYYDFDKCDIRQDAQSELDHLADIMKQNPTMEIELSSHTDQRGADDYNKRLSQCRAESAMNYLVGKGITRSRITAVGYGEGKLLKDCTTDPDCSQTRENDCPCHQNNRRTEVKILKM